MRQAEYEANPKVCPQCSKALAFCQRESRFCSRSCAATFNQVGKASHNRAKPFRVCPCGEVTHKANKWCNVCIQAGKHLRTKTSTQGITHDVTLRRYLLRTREYRCACCSLMEWCGQPIPLQVDHTDGDSDNNAEGNLRLLCPNCHAQTPTFAGRNRSKGRTRQRGKNARYAAGLKY